METGDTVRVVNAPGREDFTAVLLMQWEGWPKCVVEADDLEGPDAIIVVPVASLRSYYPEY